MTKTNTRFTLLVIASLCCAASNGACSDFEVKNDPPVARAQVLLNGAVVNLAEPIPYPGAPLVLTLDASPSKDDDGTIAKYLWMQTDVPPATRYAGNGLVDAGGLGPFMGDPMPVQMAQVSLVEGDYQFSVWVTDNEGLTSDPATVSFTILTPSVYMPDAACVAGYPTPNPDCEACVCSPAGTPPETGGCLNLYQACFENADPTFVMLCSAVVSCAITNGCMGSACYTGPCMAEITAAAMHNGGTLADCSAPGVPATNPCGAASQLGVCTNPMPTAPAVPGPCAPACN